MFIELDTCCHFEEEVFQETSELMLHGLPCFDSLVLDMCQSWLGSLGPHMPLWLKAQVIFSH